MVPTKRGLTARFDRYELPKGGIEWDELADEAAIRELREEVGIESAIVMTGRLGHLDYPVGEGVDHHTKRVRYFRCTPVGELVLGSLPERTRERRWVTAGELPALPLVNEDLRALLGAALQG